MANKTQATNKVSLFGKPASMGTNDGAYYPSYQNGSDVAGWPDNLWPHLLYFSTDHDSPTNPVTGGAGGIWLYLCNGDPTVPANWYDWDDVKENAEFSYITTRPSNPIFRDASIGTQTETPHLFYDDGTLYMYYHNNDSDFTYDNSPVQNTAVATSSDGVNWTKQQITHTYDPRNFTGTGHTGYCFVSVNPYTHLPYSYISRTRYGGGSDGANPGFAVWGSDDKLNWELIKQIPQGYGRAGELQLDPDYLSYLFRIDNPIIEGDNWRILGFDTSNGNVVCCEYLINDDFEIIAEPEIVIPLGTTGEDDEQSTRVPTKLTHGGQEYGIYSGRDSSGNLTTMIVELNQVSHTWNVFAPTVNTKTVLHSYDFTGSASIPAEVTAINGTIVTDAEGLKLTVPASSTAWIVFNTPVTPTDHLLLDLQLKGVRKSTATNIRALVGFNSAIDGTTLSNFIVNEWVSSIADVPVQSYFWLRWNDGGGNNDVKTLSNKWIGNAGTKWATDNLESPYAKHDIGVKVIPTENKSIFTIGATEDTIINNSDFDFSNPLYPVLRVTNDNLTARDFRIQGLDLVARNYTLASTLNITFSNGAVPNGTYDVDFYNDTTKLLLETRSIAFTDSTLSESLSVAASTPIFGKIDGDDMPTNGAPFYGVTE